MTRVSFLFSLIQILLIVLAPQVLAEPAQFMPPALHPDGAQLEAKQLAPGIYALVSSKPPVDNSGFVVGTRGVLVIDSHINGAMAKQIQAAVRKVTDKPILYLVNTNFHGDHTFGNYAFPAETIIVAQRKTAERMQKFQEEKQFLLQTVNNDRTVFEDARLRLPEMFSKIPFPWISASGSLSFTISGRGILPVTLWSMFRKREWHGQAT